MLITRTFRSFTAMLTLLVLPVTGCMTQSNQAVAGPSGASKTRYFPPSEFRDLDGDQFLVSRFEETLTAMGEPILYNRRGVERAVRVTWLPDSAGDRVLRIEVDSAGVTAASFKQYAFSGSALPSKIIVQKRMMVDAEDASSLWKKVQQNNFFLLTNNEDDTVVAGGTVVLLEVYEGGRYHAVYRVGPLPGAVDSIVSAALRVTHER